MSGRTGIGVDLDSDNLGQKLVALVRLQIYSIIFSPQLHPKQDLALELIWNGILAGLRMLLTGDPALWQIIGVSARVSGAALVISALLGIPLGAALGLVHFRGRRVVQAFI